MRTYARQFGRLIGTAALGVLSATPARGQQRLDETYTAQIRQFTTEPFFNTPLVDHLPASSTVPTPLTVLGHIAGAPDVLSYPEEVNRYMREVERASPRVKVFRMGESEEGREMLLVAISDEQTIARLDDYRAMLGSLADPRRTTESEASQLIARAKPIYWLTGSIHSPETGSPEMLMELVYRLAVDEGDRIREIRDKMIVFVTPVVEVDGRAKQVDIHMARRQDSTVVANNMVYWGRYVAHDNNRDGIGMGLKLSQHITRTFLQWNPTVMHDLHESASYLYTSTGRGPYNAWIDPILVSEWYRLAHKEVQDMTALGVPGIYTFDFYDGWGVNYMMWVSNSRNSIGRFYETQGSRNASNYIVTANVDRQWHRPSTPLREVVWSIRNNVNLQQSALLIAMHEVATNKDYYLKNFYLKSQRSVAKARNEGPAAYVFPATDVRRGQQARLLQLLQQHGIELNRLDAETIVGQDTLPAQSYVARLDQPFSRILDMLLDRQYYNPDDPAPYDDTGWTLGPLFNARTVRVEDAKILDAAMTPVTTGIKPAGGVVALPGAQAYIIDYNADAWLTTFRFKHHSLKMDAAEAAFDAGGRSFHAGSFIIPVRGNPRNLDRLLADAGRTYGFTAYADSAVPAVSKHPVAAPRIAVMHTWQTTQSEGWLRIGLDEYGVPYDYISVHDVRDNRKLRDSYDVILFGPSSSDARSIVRGLAGNQPLPWQKTALTPNLGSPHTTADMRGGLELQGVVNLEQFVKDGGTLVTLANSSVLPIHFDFAPTASIRPTPELWARGGVFRTQLSDRTSPLAYGYDRDLGVYFNTGPVFSESGGGGGGGGGAGGRGGGGGGGDGSGAPGARAFDGNTTARRSGRGGVADQDIVQGRARDLGRENVAEFREHQAAERDSTAAPQAPLTPRPRIVFRFSPQVADLLISGGLRNGQDMVNAPALVDAPLGTGHVVMFSFNPFWRSHTHGTYALLFNALLHHGSLGAGRSTARATANDREF